MKNRQEYFAEAAATERDSLLNEFERLGNDDNTEPKQGAMAVPEVIEYPVIQPGVSDEFAKSLLKGSVANEGMAQRPKASAIPN